MVQFHDESTKEQPNRSARTIFASEPRTVAPGADDDLEGKNFDVRGFSYVTIEDVDANDFTYSWVASGTASSHGYSNNGSAASESVDPAATTTKIEVAGSYLRVVPVGGSVRVHLIP